MKMIFALLLLLFVISAHAEHFVLFSHFSKTLNSNLHEFEDFSQVKEGDTLDFNNHKNIVLGKRLQSVDGHTMIFELKNAYSFIVRIELGNKKLALNPTVKLELSDSLPKGNYSDIVLNLKENDTVEFSNGKILRLGKRLDKSDRIAEQGTQTAVFELKDASELIVRIPLMPKTRVGIDFTIDGYDELKFLGPNITHLIDDLKGEYVIAEKIPSGHLTFLDLIMNDSLSDLQEQKMVKALARFAKKTARFTEIADFHMAQITYDIKKDEWVLFDWGDEHKIYSPKSTAQNNSTLWSVNHMIYLNSEFSDDNLRRFRPNFSHFQSQKVRDILEMLTAVTERERKNIIIKEKVNVTCKEMISFFFSHD